MRNGGHVIFYERLKVTKNANRAKVAAARRLLTITSSCYATAAPMNGAAPGWRAHQSPAVLISF